MANDLISFSLTQDQVKAIKTKFMELNALLNFTITLTPDERSVLPIMGDKTVAFVEKSLEMGKNNPQLLPPYLDLPEMQKDLEAAKLLNPLVTELEIILTRLKDTARLSGSEAYSSALVFYNTVKAAQRTNVNGAEAIYRELKERFPGRPKTKLVNHN